MSSAALQYDLSQVEKLAERIDMLADMNTTELMGSIGAEVESQTRRRISEEKQSPDGEPWEPLTDKWQARKARTSSGGILEFEGNLVDSLMYIPDSDSVEIGTDDIKAATHQFGDDDRNIPARPPLGLSEDNIDDLATLVDDFVDEQIKAAGL